MTEPIPFDFDDCSALLPMFDSVVVAGLLLDAALKVYFNLY